MFTNLRRRGAAVVVAATTLLATAGVAQAMTITLGTPDLSSRILVNVPVTVTCSPFDPSLVFFSANVNVRVEQAAGQKIAFGQGGVGGFLPVLPFACDGTPYTVTVPVLANTAGAPFHGGAAVFSVTGSANAGTPCSPGSTNCFTSPFASQFADVTTTLNMH